MSTHICEIIKNKFKQKAPRAIQKHYFIVHLYMLNKKETGGYISINIKHNSIAHQQKIHTFLKYFLDIFVNILNRLWANRKLVWIKNRILNGFNVIFRSVFSLLNSLKKKHQVQLKEPLLYGPSPLYVYKKNKGGNI